MYSASNSLMLLRVHTRESGTKIRIGPLVCKMVTALRGATRSHGIIAQRCYLRARYKKTAPGDPGTVLINGNANRYYPVSLGEVSAHWKYPP